MMSVSGSATAICATTSTAVTVVIKRNGMRKKDPPMGGGCFAQGARRRHRKDTENQEAPGPFNDRDRIETEHGWRQSQPRFPSVATNAVAELAADQSRGMRGRPTLPSGRGEWVGPERRRPWRIDPPRRYLPMPAVRINSAIAPVSSRLLLWVERSGASEHDLTGCVWRLKRAGLADVAELVDARDLKSLDL